jgi:hypothetical protein
MEELAAEIVRLQGELDREIDRRRKALGWAIRDRAVHFEQGIVAEQRRLRTNVAGFLARSSLVTVLTAPIIYSMVMHLLVIELLCSLFK